MIYKFEVYHLLSYIRMAAYPGNEFWLISTVVCWSQCVFSFDRNFCPNSMFSNNTLVTWTCPWWDINNMKNNKYFNSEFYLSIFSSRESDDTTFTLRLLISPLVEKWPHFFEKVQDTESFLSKILVIWSVEKVIQLLEMWLMNLVYVGAINLPQTKQTNGESKRQKLSAL